MIITDQSGVGEHHIHPGEGRPVALELGFVDAVVEGDGRIEI